MTLQKIKSLLQTGYILPPSHHFQSQLLSIDRLDYILTATDPSFSVDFSYNLIFLVNTQHCLLEDFLTNSGVLDGRRKLLYAYQSLEPRFQVKLAPEYTKAKQAKDPFDDFGRRVIQKLCPQKQNIIKHLFQLRYYQFSSATLLFDKINDSVAQANFVTPDDVDKYCYEFFLSLLPKTVADSVLIKLKVALKILAK
ncbi:hypothetical protein Ciccas_008264 [Cichlidogyrus casuarinus]|uniref:DUF4304 domain-containing protein n=1 Tax=Cichlidogyrus casuarinus TaxID=1844966 RepID=A0ABD2Q0Z4_9PLAT